MNMIVDYTNELDCYLQRLFPVTRSITGDGNRETLKILQELIPLKIIEYPAGQKVYDWTIPKEWKIRDAWIKNSNGDRIVDFRKNNLHVVSYSIPVYKKMKLNELKAHLHYLENLPQAIPYRTTYYKENWGFCISYEDYLRYFNENDEYEVCIDSELFDGCLSVGELIVEGRTRQEYLISTYICHPSMANDNLSGVLVTAFLAKELLKRQGELEHSYRIIFVPETIGTIAYCANNEEKMKKIKNGIVVTTCGGPGQFGYKQSWEKENWINSMVEDVFEENKIDFITYPFDIHGSDERQYSSQGFRINCISITKDKYYEYSFYHTSLDNLDFVKARYLNDALNLYLHLVDKMDKNLIYKNLYPYCEVMLSKHGLYPETGGGYLPGSNISELDMILWLLFYCNGSFNLYEISKIINCKISYLYKIARRLEGKDVLQIVDTHQ